MTIHYVQCRECRGLGTRTPIPLTCEVCESKYYPKDPRYKCRLCGGEMEVIKPMEYDIMRTRGEHQHDA